MNSVNIATKAIKISVAAKYLCRIPFEVKNSQSLPSSPVATQFLPQEYRAVDGMAHQESFVFPEPVMMSHNHTQMSCRDDLVNCCEATGAVDKPLSRNCYI